MYSVSTCDVFLCLWERDREKIFFLPGITLLQMLCATLMRSNDSYKEATTPGGFQLLSHGTLKWNNQLKQIEGNFNNKHNTALHVKINGGRGHLHMAYFR